MLRLNAGRSRVFIARGNFFRGRGGVLNPVRSTIIGNVVTVDDCVLLHNRPVVVGGVDDALIHMHDRGVVGKFVAAPLAA